MAEFVSSFTITIDQIEDYQFRVKFNREQLEPLIVDEMPPLGKEAGPTPTKLLASSIASCLCSSLLFCANKSRVKVSNIHAEVTMHTVRTEKRRLRIGKVDVEITPGIDEGDRDRAQRCIDLFEDYCTVTQSVRDGIEIAVKVKGFDREPVQL